MGDKLFRDPLYNYVNIDQMINGLLMQLIALKSKD